MKVTFKIDDFIRSVEGTESEIRGVLIAIGVVKPQPSMVEQATAAYRATGRKGWGNAECTDKR